MYLEEKAQLLVLFAKLVWNFTLAPAGLVFYLHNSKVLNLKIIVPSLQIMLNTTLRRANCMRVTRLEQCMPRLAEGKSIWKESTCIRDYPGLRHNGSSHLVSEIKIEVKEGGKNKEAWLCMHILSNWLSVIWYFCSCYILLYVVAPSSSCPLMSENGRKILQYKALWLMKCDTKDDLWGNLHTTFMLNRQVGAICRLLKSISQ